ncbi:MAG: hypothetical protein KAS02_01655 [Candidatus Pacebacteria bacterium]|nr:hypothetical protein [Candidatus Paceibacterota bacterium]
MQQIMNRDMEIIEVDTSEEAFKRLQRRHLQRYKHGDRVHTYAGVFMIVGVGFDHTSDSINEDVVWGYLGKENVISYFLPSYEGFRLIS